MKLTEKELNEFPIGTKIHCGKDTIIKADFDACNWRKMEEHDWIFASTLQSYKIDKIEIPTYAEYIPPKPILDDKEKEWFNFIKPFRNSVKYIEKRECLGKEYARIQIVADGGVISFPAFYRGRMYKGMELNKGYSLEDLRIVRH